MAAFGGRLLNIACITTVHICHVGIGVLGRKQKHKTEAPGPYRPVRRCLEKGLSGREDQWFFEMFSISISDMHLPSFDFGC